MARLALAALLSLGTVAATNPGGYTSLSEAVVKRGAAALVPKVVADIKAIVLPAVKQPLFSVDPIRFEDVSIGSYDVSVLSGQGVQLSLSDMSNQIAHTKLSALVGLIKCTGEIWASASGGSYHAMNTIVVGPDGKGHLSTVTPPGGFDIGSIEVHHQMDSAFCEAAADVLHVVDGVIIDLVKSVLQSHFADVVAKVVDLNADLLLAAIEKPLPLAFGKEKFQLDNTYLGVSYDGQRITHLHKAEFMSTLRPVESPLQPPALAASGERDVQFAFSDYVVNTLFDSLNAEHIGESEIRIPFVRTIIFDKECPNCPIVLQNTFTAPARQSFANNQAVATVNGITMDIGALKSDSTVLPMVTLSVNASAGVAFSLDQTASNYAVKATLSLQDLQQSLVVSHIGPVDMSDLTRDLRVLLTSVLDTLNKDIPAFPLPVIAGVTLGNPAVNIADRALVIEADLVIPGSTPALVMI